MKKILAMMLTAAMMLSMGAAVMANETIEPENPTETETPAALTTSTYNDMSTVTLTKEYKLTTTGTISPAETFNFTTLTCTNVENAGVGVTTANAPVPTIVGVEYAAGDAGSANAKKDITITLPAYTAVGKYTYTFNEVDGNTAGVTYRTDAIKLVVTVIEQNGKVRVAAVHTEAEGENKSDEFNNVYSAGSLSVKKNVTGIMGDQQKEFTVKVTFTAPAGDTVREAITYTDGTETKTIAAGWSTTKEATITLKHDESVTFTNIPYGVTYTVTETDYTGEGYDLPVFVGTDVDHEHDENCKDENDDYICGYDVKTENGVKTVKFTGLAGVAGEISDASESVDITNNKDGEVDTGISVDSIPYIAMLGVVALGGTGFIVSKKRRSED